MGYDFVTGGDELVKFWFVKGRNIACEIGVVPTDEVMNLPIKIRFSQDLQYLDFKGL